MDHEIACTTSSYKYRTHCCNDTFCSLCQVQRETQKLLLVECFPSECSVFSTGDWKARDDIFSHLCERASDAERADLMGVDISLTGYRLLGD